MLGDPTSCTIDLKALACTGANADGCLSREEIAAIETITKGPILNGKPYHVGFPYGAEGIARGGWGPWLVGQGNVAGPGRPSLAYGFGVDFLRYFVKQDPAWSYTAFDLSTFTAETQLLQATLSPMDPDLSAFRGRGGKLLLYHGWSDPALSALMTTRYFDAVMARDPSAAARRAAVHAARRAALRRRARTRSGRLPRRARCLGPRRAGADGADRRLRGGGARKLCAHPKRAVFKGTGDGKSLDQFECR